MDFKSILWRTVTKTMGIIIFLVIILLLNILRVFIEISMFSEVVSFINVNIGLILLMSIIFFFGELFSLLDFPLNIPYPVINAIGSIFVVKFLINILGFIEEMMNLVVFDFAKWILYIAYPLIIIIILIVGYINIFRGYQKTGK